jgi:rare lipoprotein A
MVIRTKTSKTSIKIPLGISILAGAATGTLVAMITVLSMPAVHAVHSNAKAMTRASIGVPQSRTTGSTPPFQAARTVLRAVPTAEKTAGMKGMRIIHGLASWYGGVFNGRTTASGEKFNMHELTACQPDLPFGTLVRVVNRSNKRSVVVRINDRGDLIGAGRVIDLSWAAADRLAMTGKGLARVDVEVLSLGRSVAGN